MWITLPYGLSHHRLGGASLSHAPFPTFSRGAQQGPVFAAVSSGPYDDVEEIFEGRGVLQAVESTDQILAEVLLGRDPTQQEKIDRMLNQESSLLTNVVSAASIACCKAGAKQTLVSVFDHIGAMCNNAEGGVPATGFSVINGGGSSASSLWVQVRQKAVGWLCLFHVH